MDSEAQGLVLASFTINPPEVHFRDSSRAQARYTERGPVVDIEIFKDGEWHKWGWIEREKYEEARSKSLPIVYRYNPGSINVS